MEDLTSAFSIGAFSVLGRGPALAYRHSHYSVEKAH